MTNFITITIVALVAVQATHAQLAMYLINDFVNTLNGNKPIEEGLTSGIDMNQVENMFKEQSQLQISQESTMFKKRMMAFGRIPVSELDNRVETIIEPAGVVAVPSLPDQQSAVETTVVGSPSQVVVGDQLVDAENMLTVAPAVRMPTRGEREKVEVVGDEEVAEEEAVEDIVDEVL